MASIIVVTGPSTGRFYPVVHRPVLIGRDEAADLQILDEQVSRKHLQIKYDKSDARYYAVDLQSANGVFLNGTRLSRPTPLMDNDRLQIGGSELMFTLTDFPDPESAMNHAKKAGQRGKSTLTRKT
jgi:pSer/pThr/pTyr-binding forkhead associated (FHA) protein